MPGRNQHMHRKGEPLEYRFLVAVSFPIFLVGAVFGRLLPTSQRAADAPTDARLSVFGEARAAAETYVPFAFMG